MRRGFTIVELLIVVVVIAILAAITVVAYTGITDQTRESVVRQDITKIVKTVEVYRVQNNGAIPHGTDFVNLLTAQGYSFDHDAYGRVITNASDYNVLYCSPPDDSTFSVIATTSSDKTYYIKAGESMVEYTGSKPSGSVNACAVTGVTIPDAGGSNRTFMLDAGTWRL